MAKSKSRLSKAERKEESRNNQSRKLREIPPCAARDSVLSTPELLEIIFAFFSARRLLVSGQRVCRLWKDVIDQSPRLQKHLFFRPEDEGEEGRCRADTFPASSNPLLRHAFREFFFPGHHKRSVRFSFSALRELPIADMKNGRKRHNAFIRAGASWRSMLVSQPPPRELFLVADGRSTEGGRISGLSVVRLPDMRVAERATSGPTLVRISGPVTMGLLYDLACHAALYDPKGAIVAWSADTRPLTDQYTMDLPPYDDRYNFRYNLSVPPSDKPNIVVVGTFPVALGQRLKHPSQEDWTYARVGIFSRIRNYGTKWMYLCEEYDGEAIERLIEEAEDAE
ncbi:hypothetical protein PG993_005731 [Apiospora rasikravindrae]|uniref:F-box domain-containing protein n=1 Tax=Apiospora rasikravindrae TaxID=990691 RepID=A0ABR1T9M1_9PEZI